MPDAHGPRIATHHDELKVGQTVAWIYDNGDVLGGTVTDQRDNLTVVTRLGRERSYFGRDAGPFNIKMFILTESTPDYRVPADLIDRVKNLADRGADDDETLTWSELYKAIRSVATAAEELTAK